MDCPIDNADCLICPFNSDQEINLLAEQYGEYFFFDDIRLYREGRCLYWDDMPLPYIGKTLKEMIK